MFKRQKEGASSLKIRRKVPKKCFLGLRICLVSFLKMSFFMVVSLIVENRAFRP